MKHLYQNGDGEIVAAGSKFEAAKYHDQTLDGAADADVDVDDWKLIDDAAVIPTKDDETGEQRRATAAEYAAEHAAAVLWSSTYV